jgi:rhodanese-related sulfurtransferase
MNQDQSTQFEWNHHINSEGAPEITPETLKSFLSSDIQLIDVRRQDEYTGELGHIRGARLITLETDLESQLGQLSQEKPMVFICRSGVRSTKACFIAQAHGFNNCFNLQGGMLRWGALNFPVEK